MAIDSRWWQQMVPDRASKGKQWWLATIDGDKWGWWWQWMVADSGGRFGRRRQTVADKAGGAKWWWLATTDEAGDSGGQWQTGGQLMATDDGNQKRLAVIDGGHSGSWQQTMVDNSNGRLTRSMEKELIYVK